MRSKPVVVCAAIVSAVALVGGTVALGAFDPLPGLVDPVRATASQGTQVEQTLLESYCAPRMALADAGSYGDEQFKASVGDLASSGRYAAFGSFYAARLDTLDAVPEQSLPAASGDHASLLNFDQGSADDGKGMVLSAALLKAEAGSGAAGATASWATTGDLRGLAAAACVTPTMRQSFLLGSTSTGASQQLLLANPSDKSTVVTIKAWGTSQAGPLQLATNSQVTIQANAVATVSLSSALARQDAVYVTVTSAVTPVAALVRHTAADGLTPLGNEYALAVSSGREATMPGIAPDDQATIRLFSEQATEATVSWMGAKGMKEARKVTLPAGQVVYVTLGKVPADTNAVHVSAGEPVAADLTADRAGDDGQHDFALVNPGLAQERSAVAIPDGTTPTVTIANGSGKDATANLNWFDGSGKSMGTRRVTVGKGAVATLGADDMPDGAVAVAVDDAGATLSWSVRLTSGKLDDAGVAGVSVLAPTSLMPRVAEVDAAPSRLVTAG